MGLRPKTPREGLGYAQEKDVQQKVGPRRACVPRPFALSKNPWSIWRPLPLFRSNISSKKMLQAKGLARGLGRSPKWERKAKAEKSPQTLALLGRSPNNGVQGTLSPAGVWGKAAAGPPPPPVAMRGRGG